MSESHFNLNQSNSTPTNISPNMVASYGIVNNPAAKENHITLAGGTNNIGRN